MKIHLRKQIHSGVSSASSSDKWLIREIEIPFTPFIGLSITDGDNFEGKITEIYWNFIENRMDCWTNADDEIYKALLNHWEYRPLDEILAEYLEMGWIEDDD